GASGFELRALDQALAVGVSDRALSARAYHARGRLHWQLGASAAAAEDLARTARIAEELGGSGLRGGSLGFRGWVLLARWRNAEAHDCFEQACDLFHAIGDLRAEGIMLTQLAYCAMDSRQPDKARAAIEHARELLQRHGGPRDPMSIAVTLAMLDHD